MDFRGVTPMIFEGNVAEHWKFWCQKFKTYLAASELTKKSEATQCAQLLHLIGDEGIRVYNTFTFDEDESDKIKVLIDKFEAHFSPKRNITFERHKFLTYKQQEGQTLEQFITELKNRSLSCELGDLRDSLTKDVLICGIRDEKLREKLLERDETSLDDCIRIGKNMETSRARSLQMGGQPGSRQHVDYVRYQSRGGAAERDPAGVRNQYRFKRSANVSSVQCRKCGFGHGDQSKCPAEGKICQKCGKTNHFKKMCFTKTRDPKRSSNKNSFVKNKNTLKNEIEIVECNSESEYEYDNFAFIGSVEAEGPGNFSNQKANHHSYVDSNDDGKSNGMGESWVVDLQIRGHKVDLKVDTGACMNILPISTLKKINYKIENLKKSKVKLFSYTKNQLPVIGECSLPCQFLY